MAHFVVRSFGRVETLLAVLLLAGCAADPDYREKRREDLAMWQAELADAKRSCQRQAGYLVRYPPEVGGRYRCVK